MSAPLPLDDDELLAQLRELAAMYDAPPADLAIAARAAFTLRTLDEELADLLFDSMLDDGLVGVRGTGGRQLTFGADATTIDLDVDTDGLAGQVTPPGPWSVEFETTNGKTDAPVDEFGRFFVDTPPRGPFRIRLDGGGQRVATEWVNL